MKTKELYTKDHTVDPDQEPEKLPPEYQLHLDAGIPVDWWEPLDKDDKAIKEFEKSLDECPF